MPLVVVTGPPGAGKSTLAEAIAASRARSVLVPGDRFLGFLRGGSVLPWLEGAEAQNTTALHASLRAAGAYLEGGYDVVYDGIVYPEALSTVASTTGVGSFDYLVLLPPVDTCVERVERRTGHGFDDVETTRRMHARFAGALDERFAVRLDVDAEAVLRVVLAALEERRFAVSC